MVYIEAQRIVETSGAGLAGGSATAPEQAKRKGKGGSKQGGK